MNLTITASVENHLGEIDIVLIEDENGKQYVGNLRPLDAIELRQSAEEYARHWTGGDC